MNILITGAAGFIGFHTSIKLLEKDHKVYGIDSLNNYYSVKIKKDRLKLLKKLGKKNFCFFKNNLTNENYIIKIIKKYKISVIIHLAAQAGVRHSLKNPMDYVKNNIIPTTNLLEACKKTRKIKHFLLASTSSVYASSTKTPFNENDPADFPLQFYAATKRSTELMAHSYSHLYNIPFTILRFFTVYGPYGRPDMALFKFTKNIIKNQSIELFNKGRHLRDFTYVDDIVDGIFSLIKKHSVKSIPYEIFNIGNGSPKKLLDYLKFIEKNLKRKAKIKKLPLQTGDIIKTHSDIKKLKKLTGYNPKININIGIKKFIEWYKDYYKVN